MCGGRGGGTFNVVRHAARCFLMDASLPGTNLRSQSDVGEPHDQVSDDGGRRGCSN